MAADRVTDAMVLAACNAYADKLGELYGEGEAVSAPMRAALTAALRAEALSESPSQQAGLRKLIGWRTDDY